MLKTNTMIRNINVLFLLVVIFSACVPQSNQQIVSDNDALYKAIDNAKAGDEIVMANGVWKDVAIKFEATGSEDQPIVLRAETPGKVFVEGQSYIQLGGEYLVIEGLFFRNGYTPKPNLIQFKVSDLKVATNCRVSNCVIKDFNQLSRDRKDHWVEFFGKNNQLDHCYLSGKSNEGPTVRVDIKGNRNINNYHKIVNNHFGPRPRKGGPKAETLQLGDSYSSVSPGRTTVANNLFEECNGEVEIISNKTNYNEFNNNIFDRCEGSLVMRHGNYCTIDGNVFIGDGKSESYGGIRIINTGHWVTNNFFYKIIGKEFRSPLAVMNGIPKSPQNRYNQVTDVVVAYNTWMDCVSPWQFGVGTNISQKEVLPLSEIRSARPIRVEVANNVIYNTNGDANPIVEHDKADGVLFASNYINNAGVEFKERKGLEAASFEMNPIGASLYVPASLTGKEIYKGYGFDSISKDLLGAERASETMPGAVCNTSPTNVKLMDKGLYGPSWFSDKEEEQEVKVWNVNPESDLAQVCLDAKENDVIELDKGVYNLSKSLTINKPLVVRSKDKDNAATIVYDGEATSPAFELNPKGFLSIEYIILTGNKEQYAFASLKKNMSSMYKLSVKGCTITEFDYVLKAYKQSFADEIIFDSCEISTCNNGIELAEETNDKGDYNVEFLTIDNCQFKNVDANVINYYRGGYDESTIGGNLLVSNSSFEKCGRKQKNGILINSRGIINVNIANNSFENNRVKLVALLWGAKNNTHSNNTVKKSGEIKVVENLKLTLVY